jgi:hypothetical protein
MQHSALKFKILSWSFLLKGKSIAGNKDATLLSGSSYIGFYINNLRGDFCVMQ